MSLQYRNKSKSQLTSPTPAQLPAVALSAGHIVYIHYSAIVQTAHSQSNCAHSTTACCQCTLFIFLAFKKYFAIKMCTRENVIRNLCLHVQ
jgi:hypothetical protein